MAVDIPFPTVSNAVIDVTDSSTLTLDGSDVLSVGVLSADGGQWESRETDRVFRPTYDPSTQSVVITRPDASLAQGLDYPGVLLGDGCVVVMRVQHSQLPGIKSFFSTSGPDASPAPVHLANGINNGIYYFRSGSASHSTGTAIDVSLPVTHLLARDGSEYVWRLNGVEIYRGSHSGIDYSTATHTAIGYGWGSTVTLQGTSMRLWRFASVSRPLNRVETHQLEYWAATGLYEAIPAGRQLLHSPHLLGSFP